MNIFYRNNAYKFRNIKTFMKKDLELIGTELDATLSMAVRYLNRKLDYSFPETPHYYITKESKNVTDINRNIVEIDSRVMLVQFEPENELIRLHPGDIKKHSEGIMALYREVHSFVHKYPGLGMIIANGLEAELFS